MKKLVLLIISIFLTEFSYSQSILNLLNTSHDYLNALDSNKFEDAHRFFDESIKDKVRPDDLQGFWARITNSLGAFEAVENAQNKVQNEYFLVTLDCKFAKGKQTFQFAFNKNEKIVGFVIVPPSNAAVYQYPAYADSTLYKEHQVSVKTAGHELAALLTTPKTGTNFPVLVLVHGSGPADMDETTGPNKPFKDLAMGLAAKGVATLRYVKRTRVYPGEFTKAFTLKEEVTDDALAALALAKTLPGINKNQIYLLGHSLGGMLAPKLAMMAPDVKGIVMAAAPARKFTDIIIEQNNYFFGLSKDTTTDGRKKLENTLAEIEKTRITKTENIAPDSLLLGIPASYWRDINLYDQAETAKKIKSRILLIQGEHDFQVPSTEVNLWMTALKKKRNVSYKLYPGLDHLFMLQSEKGTPEQYQKPGNVSETVINDIASWVKEK